VPASVPAGQKYQSSKADWQNTASKEDEDFKCLKFEMTGGQYYQYEYTSDSARTGNQEGKIFSAIANGNLNGDAKNSKFELKGKVVDQRIILNTAVIETDPDE
jgi:hypothetical protein